MNDEQMQPLLAVWLRDRDEAPRDANGGVARVMTNVPQARQRGRWWPVPAFHRKLHTPTPTDTTEYRPSPIPATNGHAPTVIGRTQTMFSPVKAITAGALVFAIGGVMLIAQPFEQQSAVPGAEIGQRAALVTGTMVHHYPSGGTEEETLYDGENERFHVTGATGTIETSDPRLTGDVTADRTMDFVPVPQIDPPRAELSWATVSIHNDEGLWEGQMTCVPTVATSGYQDPCFFELEGMDAYEGLSAVLHQQERLEIDGDGDNEVFVVDGLIFAGSLPPDR